MAKKTKEKHSRFLKYFEKFDFKKEKQILSIGSKFLFSMLIVVEFLILLQQIDDVTSGERIGSLIATFGIEFVLTVTTAVELFAVQDRKKRIACYIIDFITAFLLTAVTGSTFLCTIYVIILTGFYMNSEKLLPCLILCCVCMVVYVITIGAYDLVSLGESVNVLKWITQSFNDLVILAAHFLLFNFALRFYRQYLRLSKTLKELDESRAELERVYDHLTEAAVLKERQRIAKDIHDTAGHSITTVIMQTEAAKLIIDTRPEEAKSKIVAANLQAKHALEELRDNVHLLSGRYDNASLKTALESIIAESEDGTGITVRFKIDELSVSDELYRFLCNTLKEGISNGMRHGKATAFYFELKAEDGSIEFLLSDNGSGADIENLTKGLGLGGMITRAESLGGHVEFLSEDGEGFEIRMELPTENQGGEHG